MITHDGGMLYHCTTEWHRHLRSSGPETHLVGALADYLGIGTGQLAAYTVTDHSTGESYARIYWWQPPMLVARPFRHAGAGI